MFGYAGQFVFSTASGTQFGFTKDFELQIAGLRAHNRGMGDFCSNDDRLIGVALLPWASGDYTLSVLEEALEFGCGAMFTPQLPLKGTNSPTHPEYDKVWAVLEERNIPFVTHLGGGNLTAPQEFHRNDIPVSDFVGGGENMRAKDFPMVHHDSAVYFAALIYDGLFDRFPGLRGACIEQGAGWVPGWLRMLDLTQRSFGRNEPVLQNLKLKPSEYAHRHLAFTPFPHEDVGWLIEQAGDDLFLYSSDWPHPEGGRDPIRYFEGTMSETSADAKERFYSRNFLDLLGQAA
jgi:predicted TIM-barrel fold metal-dependent hydrolase